MRDRPTLRTWPNVPGCPVRWYPSSCGTCPAPVRDRARVRQAADELGYRPDPRARMLRSQRTRLLGVVFTAGQEFHAGLVDGVYRASASLGYDVLLSCVTPHHNERRAVRTLLDDHCEALV